MPASSVVLILRDPAIPSEGGGAPITAPPQTPEAPAAPAAPAPPPAAQTVLTGTRTERESDLEGQLQKERDTLKDRETKIAELEDQLSTMKQAQDDHWRPFKM
jgi:hypothetical protein